MKSGNIVLDQTNIGARYALNRLRTLFVSVGYSGLFGRLTPFMAEEGESQARAFSKHDFTLAIEILGAQAGVGVGYAHKRVYNVMHPTFSTMKSFYPSNEPVAEGGDFSHSTVDIWLYLGSRDGQHIMLRASFTDGLTIQFQTLLNSKHLPFLSFSVMATGVDNAHLSPEFFTTRFGIRLAPKDYPVIGRAGLTPYVAYRSLVNADYRFSPLNYASVNIGLEIAYGF